MRKIAVVLFTVFLNLGFFSCTPDSVVGEEELYLEACCGDGGNIPPPPPPPPPDDE